MVSRSGMAPSCLLFSTVNLMAGSTLLICSRKFYLCSFCWKTKVSSTSQPKPAGISDHSESCPFKVFHVQVSHYGADQRSHGCSLYLFIELALKGKISIV